MRHLWNITKVLLVLAFFAAPIMVKAECVSDLEILGSAEPRADMPCTVLGMVQMEYRKGDVIFVPPTLVSDADAVYLFSRQGFRELNAELRYQRKYEEWPHNFHFALLFFERSLFTSALTGALQGKRGALYLAAYYGMVNRYDPGQRQGVLDPDVQWQMINYAKMGDFEGFTSQDEFTDFAICFWESDIPSVPFETAFENPLIETCMDSGRYAY